MFKALKTLLEVLRYDKEGYAFRGGLILPQRVKTVNAILKFNNALRCQKKASVNLITSHEVYSGADLFNIRSDNNPNEWVKPFITYFGYHFNAGCLYKKSSGEFSLLIMDAVNDYAAQQSLAKNFLAHYSDILTRIHLHSSDIGAPTLQKDTVNCLTASLYHAYKLTNVEKVSKIIKNLENNTTDVTNMYTWSRISPAFVRITQSQEEWAQYKNQYNSISGQLVEEKHDIYRDSRLNSSTQTSANIQEQWPGDLLPTIREEYIGLAYHFFCQKDASYLNNLFTDPNFVVDPLEATTFFNNYRQSI